jgi:hypothetical protein
MKDESCQPTEDAGSVPADTEPRAPYVAPQVIVYGDLAALTRAVGATGNSDGGTQFGMMSSGV